MLRDFKCSYHSSFIQEMKHVLRPNSRFLKFEARNELSLKVTVDLQGCLPKNHSHARLLCYNHSKLYIIVKLVKFRIRRITFFWIWFNSKRVQAFKRKIDTIC